MSGPHELIVALALCALVLAIDAYLYRRRRYQRYREFCEYIDRRAEEALKAGKR